MEAVAQEFVRLLQATRSKRSSDDPAWWTDPTHEAALLTYLAQWKRGELTDPETGAHPLAHLAFRALALAYQETKGKTAPSASTERPIATAKELAAEFKVGLETIYDWRRQGRIPSLGGTGRAVRFDREAVRRALRG